MLDGVKDRGGLGAALVATSARTLIFVFGIYLVGGIALGLGVLASPAVSAPLVVFGVGVGLIGMLGIREWLAEHALADESPAWVLAAVALALLLAALVLIVLAATVTSGLAALAGVWIAGLGLVCAGSAVAGLSVARPVWWTAWGLGLIVAGAGLGTWQAQTDWVLVVALLGLMTGLAIANQGLVALTTHNPGLWLGIGLAIILSSVVFVLAVWWLGSTALTAMPAAVVFILGLIPLSKAAPRRVADMRSWRYATLLLFGAGAGAVLTVAFSRADWPITVAVAAILACMVFAAALVWEITELAVVLVIGAVMTTALVDRTDANPLSPHDDPPARLLVFGDSYASGEGADSFFGGTNVAGENECRRSSQAYAYEVARRLEFGLESYACSGAETYEVVNGAAGDLTAADETQLAQFLSDEAAAVEVGDARPPIAAVLISIGGNDAWFGTVGQACFGPGTCDVHRNVLLQRAVEIDSRMGRVYEGVKTAIADHTGRDVPIVAMPYPLVMTETGCEDSPLTSQEHQFLFEFTDVLDESARVQAAQAGVNFFSPGISAFDGARICDEEVWAVNVLDINPKEGTLLHRMLPTNWVHGSAHPNQFGHQMTADVLEPWLEDLLERIESDPDVPANPEPTLTSHRIFPSSTTNISTRSLGVPSPPEIECRGDQVNAVTVRIDPAVLGAEHLMGGVAGGSPVCHSEFDGTWSVTTQSSDDGTLVLPAWEREVALDFNANRHSSRQVIIWQSTNGVWRVSVHEYCELDPDCADSEAEVRAWMLAQIDGTLRGGILPVLLMFIGAWFLAVDLRQGPLEDQNDDGQGASS